MVERTGWKFKALDFKEQLHGVLFISGRLGLVGDHSVQIADVKIFKPLLLRQIAFEYFEPCPEVCFSTILTKLQLNLNDFPIFLTS